MSNYLFTTSALLIAGTLSATAANALTLTHDCAAKITPSDQQLVIDAVDELVEHQHNVEDHINDGLAAGNPYLYEPISSSKMDRWRKRVERLDDGRTTLGCQYTVDQQRCSKGLLKMGGTNGLRSSFYVCLDNIRNIEEQLSGLSPGDVSDVALTAGVMAHELMHQVDGLEGHDEGKTDPSNPETIAETIGTAMEHLVLTPDLDVDVKSVEPVIINDNGSSFRVEVNVENRNQYADAGLQGISLRLINNPSTLQLEVDGERQTWQLNPLNGGQKETFAFEFDVPLSAVGEHSVIATADLGDQFFEANEHNNVDNLIVSYEEADLAASVEIAEQPVCHSLVFRKDVAVPGYYSWFEVPFLMQVSNLDDEVSSPAMDLVVLFDDMWAEFPASTQVQLPSLGPDEAGAALFVLDVPADASCTGPLGSTHIRFAVSGDAVSVTDPDNANNVVELLVDHHYWQPDYTVRSIASFIGGLISFDVHNIGPTDRNLGNLAALASSAAIIDDRSDLKASSTIPDLAPGEYASFQLRVDADECASLNYNLLADYSNRVAEFNEANNTAPVTVRPGAVATNSEPCNDITVRLDQLERGVVKDRYVHIDINSDDFLIVEWEPHP